MPQSLRAFTHPPSKRQNWLFQPTEYEVELPAPAPYHPPHAPTSPPRLPPSRGVKPAVGQRSKTTPTWGNRVPFLAVPSSTCRPHAPTHVNKDLPPQAHRVTSCWCTGARTLDRPYNLQQACIVPHSQLSVPDYCSIIHCRMP